MCPGNLSTSSTINVSFCCQLEPQTPLPYRIRVQAIGPLNLTKISIKF